MGRVARAILLLVVLSVTAAGAEEATSRPAAARHDVLHLPGVGGYLAIDRDLKRGLAAGGVAGRIEHYNWTGGNPGLNALLNDANKRAQVERLTELLRQRLEREPDVPLSITAHSGGAAIAVWTLERLPAELQIERLILIAPALSPQYDLSRALVRVRKEAYVFSSEHDPVLGPGTRALGTMDGEHTDAAGRVGFVRPPQADAEQYRKLIPMPYRVEWIELGNAGDHIGAMSPAFVREVIAPIILGEAP